MQCFSFIKTMMILFNLLIFLCGAALLAVGIWVSIDGASFLKIFGPLSSSAMQFVNVGYFLIAAGVVVFALGFLGCYGAKTESKCALVTFFFILLLIFIAEVAAAVVALVYTTMAEHFLTLLVVPAIKKDYGSQEDFTQVWNTTMKGGCFNQLLYDIRTNAVTVGGVAAGIGGLELAAMIVSMYLYCNLQ
ncbi:tetraspanin 1, isoform CRA_b [Homo sapiens]|nr:tetraspanin 1, isoform CRA_b [Homo sapiens]